MNRETILMTLNDVSDAYILEAAPKTKVRSIRGKLTRAVAAAACLCLVLSGAYGATVYAHPASYISLDVNPSIELSLNRWSRVIGVTAYNEEAKAICDRLDLKHKFYTDAVEKVLLQPPVFGAVGGGDAEPLLQLLAVGAGSPAVERGVAGLVAP